MFIATAAPEKLANVLLESINLDVQIIGTPLQKKLRGWTSGIHCRSDDLPILMGAKLSYLINGDNNKIKHIKIKNLKLLNWV